MGHLPSLTHQQLQDCNCTVHMAMSNPCIRMSPERMWRGIQLIKYPSKTLLYSEARCPWCIVVGTAPALSCCKITVIRRSAPLTV
jgi:hypothetical protein